MTCQPNLFILGAPKCGTTSLANWLGQYSQVYVSPVKEPHHYNVDEQQLFYPERSDYLFLYSGAGEQHTYRLDASVWYLHSEVAVGNILSDCPGAKFIVCLRNPVDMAFSLYHQYLDKTGREHITPFEKAWGLSDKRLEGKAIGKRVTDPKYLAYKYSCRIGSQSLRLLRTAPREQVYFVVLDDLVQNPEQVLMDLADFLDLPFINRDELGRDNTAEFRRFPKVHRVMLKLNELKKSVGVNGFGLSPFYRSLNTVKEKPCLSRETRKQLTEYFADEIDIIWKISGRSYYSWVEPS